METIQTYQGVYQYEKKDFQVGSKIINKEISLKNLLIFKKIMDNANIKFILAYGTLLGAIRENDFISHDEDIDIVILDEDRIDFLNLLFDFRINGLEAGRYENDLLSLIKDGEYIDIYIFKKTYFGKRKMGSYLTKDSYLTHTIKYKFKNHYFDIPKEYQKYLISYYGKDWNIPKKNFHANGMGFYSKFKRYIKKNFKSILPIIAFYKKNLKF